MILRPRRVLTLGIIAQIVLGMHSATATTVSAKSTQVKLALNWKPEPEFGGFYAAEKQGDFKKAGLEVEILPGGVGTPVIQMVGAGKVDFGIASSDEVILAHSHGSDVLAVFSVYQTSPAGFMAHPDRGFKELKDIFASGKVAMQKGLPFALFLEKKYGFQKAKIVPFLGGITQFLSDPELTQQCFITSEPFAVKKSKINPTVFLIADSGYNPYAEVVITRAAFAKDHPEIVSKMVKAIRAGWQGYLQDPEPANEVMAKLNPTLDRDTFRAAAIAQKPLIEDAETQSRGLGAMNDARWKEQAKQMVEMKLVDKALPPSEYYQYSKP